MKFCIVTAKVILGVLLVLLGCAEDDVSDVNMLTGTWSVVLINGESPDKMLWQSGLDELEKNMPVGGSIDCSMSIQFLFEENKGFHVQIITTMTMDFGDPLVAPIKISIKQTGSGSYNTRGNILNTTTISTDTKINISPEEFEEVMKSDMEIMANELEKELFGSEEYQFTVQKNYLTLESSDGTEVVLRRQDVIQSNPLSDDKPKSFKIALKAHNGKYVSADARLENTPLLAMVDWIKEQESFILVELGNDKIALRAFNGKYVSADARFENTPLLAVVDWIKEWEIFTLVELDDNRVALKAFNGKYVSADFTNLQLSSYLELRFDEAFCLIAVTYRKAVCSLSRFVVRHNEAPYRHSVVRKKKRFPIEADYKTCICSFQKTVFALSGYNAAPSETSKGKPKR